jgi:putative aldouronate transport system substrate-binding protein
MKRRMKTLGIALVLIAAVVWSGFALTLTVEVFDRTLPGFVADNNFQTKYIQSQVKQKLGFDVQFVTIPRGQEVDKLNVLMAAGQAPDISFTYNESVIMNYVKSGGLIELGPILQKYGQDLLKYMGPDQMTFGQWGGKQWAVPAKRVHVPAFAAFIRKDWLDKLKLPIPKTFKEYYAALQAFKAKDPGNTGGKVMPFSIQGVDPNNIDWTVHMLVRSFVTKETDEQKMVLAGEGRWVEPGYKEGIRMLNKMFNEGLINPDFVLDKDGKQYEKDVIQGRIGSFIHNFDQPYRQSPGWQAELAKAIPGANLVPFDPFTNFEGKHAKMKYNPVGLLIVVPTFSKNAEAAVKYLNWMADADVIKMLENGQLGVQYTDEKNGIPMGRIPFDKLPDDKKFQWVDFSIIVNGYEYFDNDKNMAAAAQSYPGFEDLYIQAYKIGMRDAGFPPHWEVVIEASAKYGQILNQKGAEIFTKSVTCKPAEFDGIYDSLVKEYLAMGGQAVIDEKAAAYRAMKK